MFPIQLANIPRKVSLSLFGLDEKPTSLPKTVRWVSTVSRSLPAGPAWGAFPRLSIDLLSRNYKVCNMESPRDSSHLLSLDDSGSSKEEPKTTLSADRASWKTEPLVTRREKWGWYLYDAAGGCFTSYVPVFGIAWGVHWASELSFIVHKNYFIHFPFLISRTSSILSTAIFSVAA